MSDKKIYFPWELFKKFIFRSAILFGFVFLSLYGLFRYVFLKELQIHFPGIEWVDFLKTLFVVVFASSLVIFTGIVTFVYAELLQPFGVLYSRIKSIYEQKSEDELADEELTREEPGEWSEIEYAISEVKEEIRRSRKKVSRDQVTLQTLLNSIPEGILVLNRDGQIIFYNKTFLDFFDFSKENIDGSRLTELIRFPEIIEAFAKALREQVRQNVSVGLAAVTGAGIGKTLQISVSPLNDSETNRFFGVVGVFRDKTEVKRLEQVRIDFVANVSHELRTPLTSIKGYAQTLLQDLAVSRVEAIPKYTEIILKNSERLLTIVSDLLELSSLDSGKPLEKSEVSTKAITSSVLAQVEPIRAQKNITLSSQFEADKVWGDEMLIHQVLMNLIQNAIQHIPSSRSVKIEWKSVAKGVELSISDDGQGIAPEHQDRVFERFYRVDRDRSRDSGGTGLGLAIVKHIMLKHEGSVKLESQINKGTTFKCFFPTGN